MVLDTAAKTSKTPSSDFPLGSGINTDKQQFSYEEVKRITNNFERQLGKGGFGTVYHGHIGTTQVAVKMLSPSAHGHGYLQFQAEVHKLPSTSHLYHPDILTDRYVLSPLNLKQL